MLKFDVTNCAYTVMLSTNGLTEGPIRYYQLLLGDNQGQIKDAVFYLFKDLFTYIKYHLFLITIY